MNNPIYLWWKYKPFNENGDILISNNIINCDLYFKWRNELWNCPNPIRYPNKRYRRKNTQFSLCIDEYGNEDRMNYITSRKYMYVKEYIRLIKKLPEYNKLLDKLKNGKN